MRTESIPRPDLTQVRIVNRRTFAYKDSPNGPGYDAASGPERYLRYQITPDGVSPMAIPGTQGGAYVATGLEHTQAANTSSDARNHSAMTEKRFRKVEGIVQKAPPAHEYGDPSAEIGFLTWGSTLGVVAEAIDRLAAEGIKAHALAPRLVWPLPTHQIDPFLKGKKVVIRARGQLHRAVRPTASRRSTRTSSSRASTCTAGSRSACRHIVDAVKPAAPRGSCQAALSTEAAVHA